MFLGRYCSGAADYDVFPVYHARAGAELWSGLHVRLPQATFPVGCAAQRQHQQRVSNRFSSHSSNTACTWEYFGGFRRVLCALSCLEIVRAGSGSDGDLCCIKRPKHLVLKTARCLIGSILSHFTLGPRNMPSTTRETTTTTKHVNMNVSAQVSSGPFCTVANSLNRKRALLVSF